MTPAPDLYAALGVPRDADEATIRRAYRKAAKHAHPDGGGSVKAFANLQRALAVLTNEKARAHYDATGDWENIGADAGPSMVLVRCAEALFGAMEKTHAVETVDLIFDAKRILRENQAACRTANNTIAQSIAKLEKVEHRLRPKKGGDNPLGGMIVSQIRSLQNAQRMNEDSIRTSEEAYAMLDGYVYNFTQPQPPQGPFFRDLRGLING